MRELNTKLFSECKELYTAFKDYYDHTQSINGVVGKHCIENLVEMPFV